VSVQNLNVNLYDSNSIRFISRTLFFAAFMLHQKLVDTESGTLGADGMLRADMKQIS
jgi:hypothetical protein